VVAALLEGGTGTEGTDISDREEKPVWEAWGIDLGETLGAVGVYRIGRDGVFPSR
jgi:hypothetical protein